MKININNNNLVSPNFIDPRGMNSFNSIYCNILMYVIYCTFYVILSSSNFTVDDILKFVDTKLPH